MNKSNVFNTYTSMVFENCNFCNKMDNSALF